MISIKLSGTYTEPKDVFVKNGAWAQLRATWARAGGVWKVVQMPFTVLDATSVTFGSNGVMSYSGLNQGSLAWYWPTLGTGTVGIGSSYWLKVVKVSGTGHCNIDDGAWHSLASGLVCSNTGGAGASLSNFTIAAASDGSKVVGRGTLRVNNSA